MRPTAKWNEELPLKPKPKPPFQRRYSIALNNQKPFEVMLREVVNQPPKHIPHPEHVYEIQGAPMNRRPLTEAELWNARRARRMQYQSQFGTPVQHLPSGIVARRATVRRNRHPNAVDAFPSGKMQRRGQPFGRRLTLEAIAVSNPAAYHALAIHPTAHTHGVILGCDGSMYVRTEVGFGMPSALKKVGRVVKKGAQATGRGIAKGAKATARVTTNVAKAVAHTAVKLGKMSAQALAAAAKTVARLAATPIISAARPAFHARVKVLARGGTPTSQMKKVAGAQVIKQFMSSKNPLIKFAGLVLKYVGFSYVGGAPRRRPTNEMGMTGAEIAALAKTAAIALQPYITKMIATWAMAKGTQMIREKIAPSGAPGQVPAGQTPGRMPEANPSYNDYGTAQEAGNYQDYGSAADYQQPAQPQYAQPQYAQEEYQEPVSDTAGFYRPEGATRFGGFGCFGNLKLVSFGR